MILVTGGAGFIGANFVLDWIKNGHGPVITLDKLTYAGNLANLAAAEKSGQHFFVKGDIRDTSLVLSLLKEKKVRAIVNFAAESHVDRSIHGPQDFIETNVVGTFGLLEAARAYWETLEGEEKSGFRFLHVSTDEVFGSLSLESPGSLFTELTPYAPNSPYAASKAAADHLVRAWHHTYGLPVLTTNCSNNYGPFQFPEKLIPLVIHNALQGKQIPVYGDGQNVRDWLYVTDHCDALREVLGRGRPGETYNIGGLSEKSNIEVVHALCDALEDLAPSAPGRPTNGYRSLIRYVKDRPGHDRRYAIDPSKIADLLEWTRKESFGSGIKKTVAWYLANQDWVEQVTSGAYREWETTNYAKRSAA